MSLIRSLYKNVLDPVISAVANPLKTIHAVVSPNKTVKQVQEEFFSQSKTAQAVDFGLSVASVGAGVAGVATSAGRAVASQVVKTIVKHPIKSAVASVAIPAVVEVVKQKPRETATAIIKAPAELTQFGSDIGKFASNPSVESALNIVENSPILSAVTVVGAGVAVSKAVAPIVSGALTREAIQEQTQALTSSPAQALPSIVQPSHSTVEQLPYSEVETPESDSIIGTEPKPRRKRRKVKKASPQNITQKVYIYDYD